MARAGLSDTASWTALRGAIHEGHPGAIDALREAVAARRQEAGGHADWGRLCEAGEAGLAVSEYQLALRDDPDDVVALERLSVLYEERGDPDRAIDCAGRRVRLEPASADAVRRLVDLLVSAGRSERAREVVAESEARGLPAELLGALRARIAGAGREDDEEADELAAVPGTPGDADVVRFAHLFSGRENVYARQWAGSGGEGGYAPVREPFTFQVARNHLLGVPTPRTKGDCDDHSSGRLRPQTLRSVPTPRTKGDCDVRP